MFAIFVPITLITLYYISSVLYELYFIRNETVNIFGSKHYLITSSLVLLLSIAYLKRRSIFQQPSFNLVEIFNRFMINSKYRFNSRFGNVGPSNGSSGAGYGMGRGGRYNKSQEHKFAMLNGGVIGGISNDGNTCFMNSVIQSLASSRQFLGFIDSYLFSEIEVEQADGSLLSVKADTPRAELVFTTALKTLLENVNGSYGSRGKEFSTKPLLNKMPNGPKQNFFSGYNQEDAQEFYQLVMNILEREYKGITEESSEREKSEKEKYLDISSLSPEEYITGCQKLGTLGNVYVPATQVDPNLVESQKVFPLELITPVDGISAERIGCLTCGEVGGIRYSVNSGLSLNLPSSTSYYTSYELVDLLDKWIVPEIIEEVNCNRCGLNQTRDFLLDKIASIEETTPDSHLLEQFKTRLRLIDLELSKPHIEDEIFEKLTIKQMIKKSNKSKQIYMSRPAPLLSVHINRSVFDPRTYLIVKNPSNVTFPAQLDLAPFVAELLDINMDARRTFRKQDEITEEESTSSTLSTETTDASSISEASTASSPTHSGESDLDDLSDKSSKSSDTPSEKLIASELDSLTPEPSSHLMYNLKAVVSHYGTHNYGHYICYRKFRGSWWRISDETVHIVREQEVLDGQGTFMLFYEYDDGFKEVLQDVSESEIESESLSEDEVEESNEDQSTAMEEEPVSQESFDTEYDDESYHIGEERVHL